MTTDKTSLDTNITIRQAYLIMFEYLDRYWEETNKPDEIGALLGELSLWNAQDGKIPMDSSIIPRWIDCAKKVLNDERSEDGYRDADINLKK